MLIFRNNSIISDQCSRAVIALGNFDGLHLGHLAVIRKTLEIARAQGTKAGILTFEPHPRRVFKPDLPPLRIVSFYEKATQFKEMGIDFMHVIRFTRDFALTSADTFIKSILQGQLRASHIVTGDDFVFGHDRVGNTDYLATQAVANGFGYTKCPAVTLTGGVRCSSTAIRHMLAEGAVEKAATFLGRPYGISGIVQEGDKRGRELGFPTANIKPVSIFLPAFGVYAVQVKGKGILKNGVANLGMRPTFSGTRLQLEVHIFDFAQDIYGNHIEVDFLHYIRAEQKFASVTELKSQIAADCQDALNRMQHHQ